MKRAWQDDPEVFRDVEEAMRLARSTAFADDDYFDDNHWTFENETDETDGDDDDDSDGGTDNKDRELDAEYVKENFDRLYVKKVVRWVDEGMNVFVTGSQGRGKSTCMKNVIRDLYRVGNRLLVTGSTGTAVVNISDVAQMELDQAIANDLLPIEMASILAPATVHSAFGLRYRENASLQELRNAETKRATEAEVKMKEGVDDEHVEQRDASKMADGFMREYIGRHQTLQRLFVKGDNSSQRGIPAIAVADMVIIDEISMIDDLLMEVLDRVGRFWRPSEKHRPFGGLRMVFVGDFQQLPPVGSGTRQNPIYLFENEKWKTRTACQGWVDRVLHLKTNIRQEGDVEYGRLLDRMVENNLTAEDEELLQKCVLRPANGMSGLQAALNPRVMPGVMRVFNSQRLIKQFQSAVIGDIDPDKKITFESREEYEPNEDVIFNAYGETEVKAKVDKFIQGLRKNVDQDFYLECPVRILENKDVEGGIVNGAIGTLKGCSTHGKHPIIELKNGKRHTLLPSSAEIFVDDYHVRQRREIKEGRLRPRSGRPLGRFTYRYYPMKMACAVTPHGLQGLTAETLIIHPNVDHSNEYTTVECYFTALSRLSSSGLDDPGKAETLRATPRPTSHLGTSDEFPDPRGLYLTRRPLYPFYVGPKVRAYIDDLEENHSLIKRRRDGEGDSI